MPTVMAAISNQLVELFQARVLLVSRARLAFKILLRALSALITPLKGGYERTRKVRTA